MPSIKASPSLAASPAAEPAPSIAIGDRVEKFAGGYGGPGIVRMVWTDDHGVTRVIVGHKIEGGWGELLHIYSPKQLRPIADRPLAASPVASDAGAINREALEKRAVDLQRRVDERDAELASLRRLLDKAQRGREEDYAIYQAELAKLREELAEKDRRIAELEAGLVRARNALEALEIIIADTPEDTWGHGSEGDYTIPGSFRSWPLKEEYLHNLGSTLAEICPLLSDAEKGDK